MLIKCPECNHEVSDTAETCPNCGFKLKQNSDVCPYCKGTGKNPKKYNGFVIAQFPQIRRIVTSVMMLILLLFLIVSFAIDRPYTDFALPTGYILVMIAAILGFTVRKCPICNGTGKAISQENE